MTDPLINPHSDPTSQRAYNLIFCGLSRALTEWMPLSERARISQAIYDELRDGGLEVRFMNGLEYLRLVAMTMGPTDRCTCLDIDVTYAGELPGSRTVKGYDANCPQHERERP